MEQFNYRLTHIETKRSDNNEGWFSGYASDFLNEPDYDADIIEEGAFAPALRHHAEKKTLPALLWHHDRNTPIGKWLAVKEDHFGLAVTGKFTLGVEKGREAFALLKDGALSLSIGFVIANDGCRRRDDGIRVISKISYLPEISVVCLPANPRARIQPSRPKSRKEFESTLRHAMNLTRREAKLAAAVGYKALDRNDRDISLDVVLDEIQSLRSQFEKR